MYRLANVSIMRENCSGRQMSELANVEISKSPTCKTPTISIKKKQV